jgi:hypothetical protein
MKKVSKYLTIYVLVITLCGYFGASAQIANKNSGYNLLELSNPKNLALPGADAPGYPSRSADLDILPGFQNPPVGYGEVPFWWWTGDSLTKDRLLWQIEELHKKGISGMQINYSHTQEKGWPTDKSDPELFSEEWWDVWKFVANESGKRNMSIGLSGYTIDWPNGADNLFSRLIYSIAEINGRSIEIDTIMRVSKGKMISIPISAEHIGVWVYPVVNGKITSGGIDLQKFVKNSKLNWKPANGEWDVYVFSSKRHPGTINPIHPLAGKMVIEKFFQRFQENTVDKTANGLNYFFQDELHFGVGDLIWTDDFNDVFKKIKGYNVFEILPALYTDMGQVTVKARLDYMDVKIHLSEERYFKPIFDWHWSRGKIYGCDSGGRGKNPIEFGDYFRATRWYTAPGHDTPGGKADLIKGKVSSSIANLYQRPRVWLEGYHSMGWQATPERLMFATSENYLYGCNLLNLHGLYYTTHGSFWEWAPPDYHFRMPYWDHMGVFLKYFERLSYLLSHGTLQSDVAILYPTSAIQGDMHAALEYVNGNLNADKKEYTKAAFESGTQLFNNGHDFIFIDDQSLSRADISNKEFNVSDASYKVLVLPALKSVRWETIQQALKFYRNGGIVVAVESLPNASDRIGSNDSELNAVIKEIFGLTGEDMTAGTIPQKQMNKAGGIGLFVSDASMLNKEIINLMPKHVSSDKLVRSMHRKIGKRDVYMVMGDGKDINCLFRSKGKVEQWDPWTGKVTPLYGATKTTEGTRIKLSFNANQAQIIVFSPEVVQVEVVSSQLDEISKVEIIDGKAVVTGYNGTPGLKQAILNVNGRIETVSARVATTPSPIILDGDWGFELKPTMDNRWGDFRLPVTEQMIGAEARILSYAQETSEPVGWELPNIDDSAWPRVTYGFGQKFWKLGPLPNNIDYSAFDKELSSNSSIDPTKPVTINGERYTWESYDYSWRMGIEGDPGDQKGFHGLKERVTDDFIKLAKPSRGNNNSVYYMLTSAYVSEKTKAQPFMGEFKPVAIYLNNRKVTDPTSVLNLNSGFNSLLLRYDKPGRGHYVLGKEGVKEIGKRTPLAMTWWDMKGRVAFDVNSSQKSPAGWYRFTAPPGLQAMTIRAIGKIKVWVDGKLQDVKTESDNYPATYQVNLPHSIAKQSKVAVRIESEHGYYGGAALPEPILLNCVAGIGQIGNWSEGSVLECYSGGVWYRKNISLSKEQSSSKVMLNLGKEVIATAEVRVNGQPAGILVAAPWQIDISTLIKTGNNSIEVLVYNTLVNHFRTIPSTYTDKSQKSGLLGPVKLEFSTNTILK